MGGGGYRSVVGEGEGVRARGRLRGTCSDSGEDGGGDGEVEDAVSLLARALGLLHSCIQSSKIRFLVVLTLQIRTHNADQ